MTADHKEILNAYVTFPFDKEQDKDLLDDYSKLSLLISQIDQPLLEELKKDEIYHIVITCTVDPVNVNSTSEPLLTFTYKCPTEEDGCGHWWREQHTSACDSICPKCGLKNITALSWQD